MNSYSCKAPCARNPGVDARLYRWLQKATFWRESRQHVLCFSTCCHPSPSAGLRPTRCQLLGLRLRGLLRVLQALQATGETASRQQKVSNPPPEANLEVGFLVLGHSRGTPAQIEGVIVMDRRERHEAERSVSGALSDASQTKARNCGGLA